MKQVSLRRQWLGKARQRYKDKKVKATAERWSCMRQEEWSKWVVARCCHGWRWWSKRDWRAKVPASSGTFQRRSSNCLRVDRFEEKINLSKSSWGPDAKEPRLCRRTPITKSKAEKRSLPRCHVVWDFWQEFSALVSSFLRTKQGGGAFVWVISSFLLWLPIIWLSPFLMCFVPGVIPAYPKCCQTSRLWKGEALECVGCLLRPRCPKPCESRHS